MRWGALALMVMLACDSGVAPRLGTQETESIVEQLERRGEVVPARGRGASAGSPARDPEVPGSSAREPQHPGSPPKGAATLAADRGSLAPRETAFPQLYHGAPKKIRVRVSRQMWTPSGLRPTSKDLIDMVTTVLDTWERAVPGVIDFDFDGFAPASEGGIDGLPDDGAVTIFFDGTGEFISDLNAGLGSYRGTIPGDYRKGYVFMNPRRKGRTLFGMSTLLHELGHAVGIGWHVPTPGSVMSCGSKGWVGDYAFLSEQDRVNLVYAWHPSDVYSISGRVDGAKHPFVFAVSEENGRTYSTIADKEGGFAIPIARPGRYFLFAKGYESSAGAKPVAVAPSWYVGAGSSSNEPKKALAISLDASTRHVSGLRFPALARTVPFNLFWSVTHMTRDGSPYIPSFLAPGERMRFQLISNGGRIDRIEAFGKRPDYRLSELRYIASSGTHFAVVEALPGAVPGHRLVLARGPAGVIQAGLVGIHVVHPDDKPKSWHPKP